MPVFNGAAGVDRAIRSIQDQTVRDWQLIVIDDGSTDGTDRLLADWSKRDHRVQFFRIDHSGIVAALNFGIEKASAPFIARMDADDEASPDRLESQFSFLSNQPNIGLAGSLVEFGGDSVKSRGYALHVEWMNTIRSPEEIALNRFIESPFAHPSVMFRRALIERHGGYRQGDFPEDYELWLRWLDAGVAMAKVPAPLLRWNDTSDRLSRTDPRYSPNAFYRCKSEYLGRWIVRHVPKTRPILIWGAGRPTRKRAEYLIQHGIAIAGYIDIDVMKQGRRFGDRPVFPFEDAPREAFVLGYVANRGARQAIRAQLRHGQLTEGIDFLMAA